MTQRSNLRPILSALARRAWIQQGTMALWISLVAGTGLVLLGFFAGDRGTKLGAAPELIPAISNGLITVYDATGNAMMLPSYTLTMAPVLLGLLVATVATLTLPGVVADDIRGGGMEVLLAGPIPRRTLFTAYLGATVLLAGFAWVAASASFLVAAAIVTLIVGAKVSISAGFTVAMLVLPLGMGLWSASVTLFGALLYPSSLDSKAGMNGGPIRILAVLPPMLALPAVLFLNDWVLPALAAVTVVAILASLVIIQITSRGFRSVRVLGA